MRIRPISAPFRTTAGITVPPWAPARLPPTRMSMSRSTGVEHSRSIEIDDQNRHVPGRAVEVSNEMTTAFAAAMTAAVLEASATDADHDVHAELVQLIEKHDQTAAARCSRRHLEEMRPQIIR